MLCWLLEMWHADYVCYCEKRKKKKQTKTPPKHVSTLNAVFYRTSCGSLQIHHLQTHDLYATHTEDHVGKKKKRKTIGGSLCTEPTNKLPLTQSCCQISWLLCDYSVLVCVLSNILTNMSAVMMSRSYFSIVYPCLIIVLKWNTDFKGFLTTEEMITVLNVITIVCFVAYLYTIRTKYHLKAVVNTVLYGQRRKPNLLWWPFFRKASHSVTLNSCSHVHTNACVFIKSY